MYLSFFHIRPKTQIDHLKYADSTCYYAEDGITKLPCPDEFGAILGTATITGIFAIGLAFVPPKAIRKTFPPLITGAMLMFIGAALVSSGVNNWLVVPVLPAPLTTLSNVLLVLGRNIGVLHPLSV